ncbi:MAG: hypothetical protein OHK0029_06670 [Armatimonadaceae bacterium]
MSVVSFEHLKYGLFSMALVSLLNLAMVGAVLPRADAAGVAEADAVKEPAAVQASEQQAEVFTSLPLEGAPLGRWNRILVRTPNRKEGTLALDPNRISWNGYSKTWVSTRMAEMVLPIRLSAVKGTPNRPEGKAKLYDVQIRSAQTNEENRKALGLPSRLRLMVSDDPNGPVRLLFLNEKEQIERVVPLERKSDIPPAGPPRGDVFSLQSSFLGSNPVPAAGLPGRQVTLSGSLVTNQATLTLDPNGKILNAFGDAIGGTLIAPNPIPVTLKKIDGLEGLPEGQSVYELDGAPLKMRLVLSEGRNGAARLLIMNDEKTSRILPLENWLNVPGPLRGATWRLERIVYNNDTEIKPAANQEYTIQFLPDGRFAGRAGANRILGTFTAAENGISFSPVASTRAAELENSITSNFLKALGQVTSYAVEGDRLMLMLKYDSGTILLNRVPNGKR